MVSGSLLVAGTVMGLIGASRRPVVVLDVADHAEVSAEVSAELLALYPRSAQYFKVNLK